MDAMEIDADFRADLCELCKQFLEQNGYKVRTRKWDKKEKKLLDEPVEPYYFVIQYCNVEHRFVLPRPRAVVKHPGFVCPPGDEAGLHAFLAKVEAGGELMRHASTKIRKADYPDALFNDWHIHHFHLGTTIGKGGFAKRSANVLLAMVTGDALYCIDILPHEDVAGNAPWTKQHLVEIVHEHWPFLIERGRLPGVMPSRETRTEQELQELREAGVIVPIYMRDGTAYAAIGGGYATSRDSTRAVERAMQHLQAATRSEKHLRETIGEIATWAADAGRPLPERPHFKLMIDDTHFLAVESTAEVSVRLAARP